MSLFGGGLDKATKAYNSALRDYNTWQMDQNRQLYSDAGQYVNLQPSSDIAYDTISGRYLNSNPYINNVANNVSQQIIDNYNKSYIPSALSSFANSGRFGSGLFQQTLADTQSKLNQDVGNAMNNLYYRNYAQERALQESARSRAAQQYDPLNRYSSYSGILNAFNPGQPVPTQESGSKLGAAIQGALQGAITGGVIGGPWGAAGGALAGGTMGALS